MRCAIGLSSVKTTKDIGTHMRKFNIFGWKSEDRSPIPKKKITTTLHTLAASHFRLFAPSFPLHSPINHTISHTGINSTSSFLRTFNELLICNSTVRFEIPSLSEIS